MRNEPKPLRIPSPDHDQIEVTLCGEKYAYKEPSSKLKYTKLQGLFVFAYAKMSEFVDKQICADIAQRMAEAENAKDEAQIIESEMITRGAMWSAAGLLAIEEIFEAVCSALKITGATRRYLEDNFETGEMMTAFGILFGLVQRPFGGMPKGTHVQSPPATDSTNSEKQTS
jgi:hypothetical protein